MQPQQQPTNPSGGLQPSSVSAASSAAGASAGATGGSTSWASAASKGLPPSSDPGANGQQAGAAGAGASSASASTSKQLEQLNSVREALFSQDGWGGSNVKQDTSWDVDNKGGNSIAIKSVPVQSIDWLTCWSSQSCQLPAQSLVYEALTFSSKKAPSV